MKIAVVSANGKVGQLVVKEGLERGLDVTAIVRGDNKTLAKSVIKKDLFALTKEDLIGFDVIVDAFGTWKPDTLIQHSTSLKHLADLVSNEDQRLLVVGGAGSLYLDKEHTLQLVNSEGFPEMFKPLAQSMSDSLDELRQRDDVRWTYISPAGDFQAEGIRTGEYILAGEELTLNDKGESIISYADYAIAMIDEAISGKHIKQRISVVKA